MSGRRISVVIPSYNGGSFLIETLESALAQTHDDREIIVVDDGSTDNTKERLGPYLDQIRYVRQDNAGVAAARNHGIKLASGDYIALLDADDLWNPRKLEVQMAVATCLAKCGLIACDGVMFDGEKILKRNLLAPTYVKLLRETKIGIIRVHAHPAFIGGSPISCPSQTLIPREVIETIGPFVGDIAADYDYYLRISQRYLVAFHAHKLVRYRYRSDSMSGLLEKRHSDLYPTIATLRDHLTRCDNDQDRKWVAEAIKNHEDYMSGKIPMPKG